MNFSERARRIKPSPTIAVSTKAQQLKAEGKNIINLGAGEPDFDTPEHIKEAAIAAIKSGKTKYTAVGGIPSLKEAIVEKLSRENNLTYAPEEVMVSVGAKHCLLNIIQSLVEKGDEVLIPAPYWVSYPDMTLLANGTPKILPTSAATGYKVVPEQLESAITPQTKLLILNSPSNPTGSVYSAEDLSGLAGVLVKHPHVIVCTDDIYEHVRYTAAPFSNIVNANEELKSRTIVVNGVSKAYAMTGWRIGYAAGPADAIKVMTKIQSQGTSNPSSISQAAAEAALRGGIECTKPMLEAFTRRRDLVISGVSEVPGLSCHSIDGAFYGFIDAKSAVATLHDTGKLSKKNDIALCEFLLEEAGVAVVPGSAFGCDDHFRLSFATSDENISEAIDRVSRALS